MNFQDFDFALFIKDESVPDAELKSRSVLYQDEMCDLYILMRRKNPSSNLSSWELSVQTIHALIFLIARETSDDIVEKSFNEPLIYKDLLLKATFKDVLQTEEGSKLPMWLSTFLSKDLFDCFYKCTLRVDLPEKSVVYSSLLDGKEFGSYMLQAVIKPCPTHLSSYQLLYQSNTLPYFSTSILSDNPLCRRLSSLALMKDNFSVKDHKSLNVPIQLQNHLILRIEGQNGRVRFSLLNKGIGTLSMIEFYLYISDVIFLDELSDSKDVRIVHSRDYPKHDPSVLNDLHISREDLQLPFEIEPCESFVHNIAVEYTQNHAHSTVQSLSERCDCDVYIRLCLKWREAEARYPISRVYDVCARLHPKPQIEVKYEQIESLKPLEANKLRFSVLNLSLKNHSNFKVAIVNSNEVLCGYVDQTIRELLPHSQVNLEVTVIPQVIGMIRLPTITCIDASGHTIPTVCQPPSVFVESL